MIKCPFYFYFYFSNKKNAINVSGQSVRVFVSDNHRAGVHIKRPHFNAAQTLQLLLHPRESPGNDIRQIPSCGKERAERAAHVSTIDCKPNEECHPPNGIQKPQIGWGGNLKEMEEWL